VYYLLILNNFNFQNSVLINITCIVVKYDIF